MKSTTLSLCLLAGLATAGHLYADIINTNVARCGVFLEATPSYNSTFPITTVIDGNTNEGTNATPVSYWLTPNGLKNAYFFLDLRGLYTINSVVFYNTHNRQYYDRGTGPFLLYAAKQVELRPAFPGTVYRYYRFEGDMTDASALAPAGLFRDAAGNAVTPTFAADVPTAVAGDTQSLTFSGGGEFLELVDQPLSGQPTAYSISVWVKFSGFVQPCNILVRCAAAGEQVNYSHQLRVNATLNFEAYTFDGNLRTVSGTTVVQPDTWYHVAVTAQNNDFEHLYVNGIEEGVPAPIATLWSGGDRWRVGTGSGGGFAVFNGQMDELAYWLSTPLSSAAIARLAAGEKASNISTTPSPSTGYQMVNPLLIVSNTLSQAAAGQPIVQPDTFALTPPVTARYLIFYTLGGAYANNNIGLNEMQVMADVDIAPPALHAQEAIFLQWANRGVQEVLQTSPTLAAPQWAVPATRPAMQDTNWNLFQMCTNGAGFYRLIGP